MEELKRQLSEQGEETGSEDDEPSGDEAPTPGSKPRRRRRSKGMSKDKKAEIMSQIETDRKALEDAKNAEEELKKREEEIKAADEEQRLLAQRLSQIEKKIIVGGENLLEKAEEQERLLAESAAELEQRQRREDELREALEAREAERLDIEEKYSTLQEEAAGKTKKLKKVWTMYMAAKSEMADLQQEHQREMEGLLENVRQLSRELKLHMLIIDSFIPHEYQNMIEQHVHWNEDIGEWQLKCVAYTGNNMRKQTPVPDRERDRETELDLSHVYYAYSEEGAALALGGSGGHRPKTRGEAKGRPKTASGKEGGRAKSAKEGKKKTRNTDADINSLLQ